MSLPLPSDIGFSDLLLERRKVAARYALGSYVRDSLEARVVENAILDSLVYQLQGEVLAERVLDTEVTVPWSDQVTVPTPARPFRGLPFALGIGLGTALHAVLYGHVVYAYAALLVFVVSAVLYLLNRVGPGTTGVAMTGSVTVPATYWRTFPDATIRYPDHLGGPIRVAVLGTPTVRWSE